MRIFIVIFLLFNSFDSFVSTYTHTKAGRYGSSSRFRFLCCWLNIVRGPCRFLFFIFLFVFFASQHCSLDARVHICRLFISLSILNNAKIIVVLIAIHANGTWNKEPSIKEFCFISLFLFCSSFDSTRFFPHSLVCLCVRKVVLTNFATKQLARQWI